jgi:hypothetical protein
MPAPSLYWSGTEHESVTYQTDSDDYRGWGATLKVVLTVGRASLRGKLTAAVRGQPSALEYPANVGFATLSALAMSRSPIGPLSF